MQLMIAGTWIPGQSHSDVALAHGVSPATVKDWATSASRVIRTLHEVDREELRAASLAVLSTVVSRALAKRKPDLKAAIMGIAERNKLLGLITQKHDVSNRPSVAHLSREEHAKALAELRAEIDAEEKRLAEEGS